MRSIRRSSFSRDLKHDFEVASWMALMAAHLDFFGNKLMARFSSSRWKQYFQVSIAVTRPIFHFSFCMVLRIEMYVFPLARFRGIFGTLQCINFIFTYNNYQVAFCGCPEVTPTPTIQIWQKVPRLKAEYLVQRIECISGQFSPP